MKEESHVSISLIEIINPLRDPSQAEEAKPQPKVWFEIGRPQKVLV